MSVRTGDRGETKLLVLDKARLLKEYSINKVRSDKNFPKSTRWLYAQPIAVATREVCSNIRCANSIRATCDEEYNLRREYQLKAYAVVHVLYECVEDCFVCNYIDDDSIYYWLNLIEETEESLRNWIRSDKKKYVGQELSKS